MKSTASQCPLPEYNWLAAKNGSKEGRAAYFLQLIQPYTQPSLQVTARWDLAFRAGAVLQRRLKGSMSETTKLAWR